MPHSLLMRNTVIILFADNHEMLTSLRGICRWGLSMRCDEYDRLAQDVGDYRRQLSHLLVPTIFHGPLDDAARRSAHKVASTLAQASDELHWHDSHCHICRQASHDRDRQLQFSW
jgi:hypothetical protein